MAERPWKFESSRPHQKLFIFKVLIGALAQFGTKAFGRPSQKHDQIAVSDGVARTPAAPVNLWHALPKRPFFDLFGVPARLAQPRDPRWQFVRTLGDHSHDGTFLIAEIGG